MCSTFYTFFLVFFFFLWNTSQNKCSLKLQIQNNNWSLIAVFKVITHGWNITTLVDFLLMMAWRVYYKVKFLMSLGLPMHLCTLVKCSQVLRNWILAFLSHWWVGNISVTLVQTVVVFWDWQIYQSIDWTWIHNTRDPTLSIQSKESILKWLWIHNFTINCKKAWEFNEMDLLKCSQNNWTNFHLIHQMYSHHGQKYKSGLILELEM